MAKATMTEVRVAPHARVTVVMDKPLVLFQGERFVNKADRDGLVVECIFVGQVSQRVRDLAFSDEMALVLDPCDPVLSLTVQVRNDSDGERRVHFKIEGRRLR